MIASYAMIEKGTLSFEVWNTNRWKFNTFLGSISLPLKEIVVDYIHKSLSVKKYKEKKTIVARISYLCYF